MDERKNPSASVIIYVYNWANLVLDFMDSMFAKTHREFETIIIDDDPTGITNEVLFPLAKQSLSTT